MTNTDGTLIPPPALPDAFWRQRQTLQAIRQAALARTTSPDAVFHAVLARLAAFSPSDLLLPAYVGGEVPLNYFAALVAPSGAGKSTSSSAARALLAAPLHLSDRDNLPVGTGEGLIESFFERDPDSGEKVQAHRNLYLYVDEGETFARLGARDGTTLDTVIRSAFSGQVLGQRNAQKSTTRILPANSYSIGMTVGYQPAKAGALLAQVDGGTPQRFMWAYAGLQAITDEELFGAEWPGLLQVRGYDTRTGIFNFPEDIKLGIIRDHLQVARGEKHRHPLDSHEPVHLMRTAALLALMEGRIQVTQTDWTLARTVWSTSRKVRQWVADEVRQAEMADEELRLARHANQATAQVRGREYAAEGRNKTAARITQELAKAGETGLAASHIKRNLTPQQRLFWEDATVLLLRQGVIEAVPGAQRLRLAQDDAIVIADPE